MLGRAPALAAAVALLAASCGSPGRTGAPAGTTTATATTTAPTPTPTTTTTTTIVLPSTTAARPATTSTSTATTTVPARSPAVVIYHGRTDRKLVALTFDAGSDAGNTGAVLDVLAAHHIRATFGITGAWAQANPELVRRIASAGHQIVDHSWDHRSFTGASTGTGPLTATQIAWELQATEDLIHRLTGSSTNGWFRPPYGDRNQSVDAAAGTAGYRYELMWTVDTLGWKGLDAAAVVQRALGAAGPGEIVLMHVGSQSTDSAALPALIAALQARGLGFGTVSDIA